METGGWVMMIGSITIVLCLVGYCLYRTVTDESTESTGD